MQTAKEYLLDLVTVALDAESAAVRERIRRRVATALREPKVVSIKPERPPREAARALFILRMGERDWA